MQTGYNYIVILFVVSASKCINVYLQKGKRKQTIFFFHVIGLSLLPVATSSASATGVSSPNRSIWELSGAG